MASWLLFYLVWDITILNDDVDKLLEHGINRQAGASSEQKTSFRKEFLSSNNVTLAQAFNFSIRFIEKALDIYSSNPNRKLNVNKAVGITASLSTFIKDNYLLEISQEFEKIRLSGFSLNEKLTKIFQDFTCSIFKDKKLPQLLDEIAPEVDSLSQNF